MLAQQAGTVDGHEMTYLHKTHALWTHFSGSSIHLSSIRVGHSCLYGVLRPQMSRMESRVWRASGDIETG